MSRCRLCLDKTAPVLSLNPTPIANSFPSEPQPYAPRFPLGLARCMNCGHVQISHEIPGAVLFSDYRYQTPQAERERLTKYAAKLRAQFSGSVLEIGCNNGILTEELNKAGFTAMGVDPAAPVNGLPRWFNSKTATQLRDTFGQMDLILGNNVFAHVDDLRNTFMGIKTLLKPSGSVVFEVQYLPDMVAGGMFDMIYHEHKDYHTLAPIGRFLRKFGMCVYNVEHLPTHGGSIRVYVKFGDSGVQLKDPKIDWNGFKQRIESEGARLREQIESVTGRIVAFGATAKACTLLHHFRLASHISYCVDETSQKQGRYIAGTSIEISPWERMKKEPPAAVLLTAWNYVDILRPRFDVPLIVPFEKETAYA